MKLPGYYSSGEFAKKSAYYKKRPSGTMTSTIF